MVNFKEELQAFVDAPMLKSLMLIVALTALFSGLSYMAYIAEYVLNSGFFTVPATILFYGSLISVALCGVFWVKQLLKFTKELQSYHSLITDFNGGDIHG